MINLTNTFILALLCSSTLLTAQITSQDCLGAIPVCQDTYTESTSPSGEGGIPNEMPPGTCTAGEINSLWYVFTASEDGDIGFLITPNNLNDDYDWALFDITNTECGNLQASDVVSCNAAGGAGCHGVTGCSVDGVGNNTPGGCFGNGPLNELVPSVQGNTYALMVSNWTGSTHGYTLDFSGSSGLGIFDESAPEPQHFNLLPSSCEDNRIEIEANEFLTCESINDSDFELIGPGGPYSITASSNDCNSGSEHTKNIRLIITPPINSMGSFTLNISPSASDHLLDLCGNQMQDFSLPFDVDVPIDVDIDVGRDTSLLCAGDQITLDASDQGILFEWGDGSTNPTLTVNNEGVYHVTVTNECGIGSDSIEVFVQLQPPSVDFGPDQMLCEGDQVTLDADNGIAFYDWHDSHSDPTYTTSTTGTYAVTVTNGCGEDQDEIELTFVPDLDIDLASEYVLCAGDTLTLDLSRPFASYQWSDGSTDAIRIITMPDSYSVTVSTVCETYEASFDAVFLVDPALELGDDFMPCPEDTIILAPNIPGAMYTWQDGSTNDTLIVTETGGYAVSITTACNELEDSIYLEYHLPITSDLGRDTFLCPEDPFLLDARTDANAKFVWEDGSQDPKRRIVGPGLYIVEVSTPCEVVIDSIQIDECEICNVYMPNIFSPNYDGVNDEFYPQSDCGLSDYSLSIYDRWGTQVFLSNDPSPQEGWEGKIKNKAAPAGVYIWFMEYTVIENGYPIRKQQEGDIALIR